MSRDGYVRVISVCLHFGFLFFSEEKSVSGVLVCFIVEAVQP